MIYAIRKEDARTYLVDAWSFQDIKEAGKDSCTCAKPAWMIAEVVDTRPTYIVNVAKGDVGNSGGSHRLIKTNTVL